MHKYLDMPSQTYDKIGASISLYWRQEHRHVTADICCPKSRSLCKRLKICYEPIFVMWSFVTWTLYGWWHNQSFQQVFVYFQQSFLFLTDSNLESNFDKISLWFSTTLFGSFFLFKECFVDTDQARLKLYLRHRLSNKIQLYFSLPLLCFLTSPCLEIKLGCLPLLLVFPVNLDLPSTIQHFLVQIEHYSPVMAGKIKLWFWSQRRLEMHLQKTQKRCSWDRIKKDLRDPMENVIIAASVVEKRDKRAKTPGLTRGEKEDWWATQRDMFDKCTLIDGDA